MAIILAAFGECTTIYMTLRLLLISTLGEETGSNLQKELTLRKHLNLLTLWVSKMWRKYLKNIMWQLPVNQEILPSHLKKMVSIKRSRLKLNQFLKCVLNLLKVTFRAWVIWPSFRNKILNNCSLCTYLDSWHRLFPFSTTNRGRFGNDLSNSRIILCMD